MSALIEFDQVCKYYQMGDTLVEGCRPYLDEDREGGVRGHRGPVRLGQVHLHEHHRLSGRADGGRLSAQWQGRGQDEPGRAG